MADERTLNYADIQTHIVPAIAFVESEAATEAAEDWSKVRSPSRARRRLKAGIPNRNIRRYRRPAAYKMGDTIYIHPELLRQMKQKIVNRMDSDFMKLMTFGPRSPDFDFNKPIKVEPPERESSVLRYEVFRTMRPGHLFNPKVES